MVRLAPGTRGPGCFSLSKQFVGTVWELSPGRAVPVWQSACRDPLQKTMPWALLLHLVSLPKGGPGCVQYTVGTLGRSWGMALVLAPRKLISTSTQKLIYPVRFHMIVLVSWKKGT